MVPVEWAASLEPRSSDQALERIVADEEPVEIGDRGVLRAEVGVKRRDDAIGKVLARRREPSADPFGSGAGLAPRPGWEAGRSTITGQCAVLVADLVSALWAAEGDVDLGDTGSAIDEEESTVSGENGVVVVDRGARIVPGST